MTRGQSTVRYDKLFIGGEWVPANSKRYLEMVNPATGQVWAQIAEADETDVDRAVTAAKRAFHSKEWQGLSPSERGRLLYRLADLVEANLEEIAAMEARDNGSIYRELLVGDVPYAANVLRYFAGLADKIQGSNLPIAPHIIANTTYRPLGVAAGLIPWNAPIITAAMKIGPAIAAGCTIVLKPSEYACTSVCKLMELVEQAGFPAGVINCVPGYGPTTGQALVTHPDVRKVSLTGSAAAAVAISKSAAPSLKRVNFENGGKNPFIIFEDADFDQALIVATMAAFTRAGQSCTMTERIYVQRSRYEEFVTKLAERANRIQLGDPFSDSTQMGPIANDPQLEKIEHFVDVGIKEGSTLVAGGNRDYEGPLQKGRFYRPTVFAVPDNSHTIVREEIFGPVVGVVPFDDEDEVVAMANDTEYGLVAGVWSNDLRRAKRVSDQINAGLVWINGYRFLHWTMPYGGFKMSGVGRENGLDAIHLYTEPAVSVIDLTEDRPDPYDPRSGAAIGLQGFKKREE